MLTAPGGYIVDIPKGNLKTEIEKLAKQLEYAYLKQLQTAGNVNWKQVQLVYDKWDYKQEGLTGSGVAIVALVVAAATGGVGAGFVGAVQGTASAAMANAAFTSLATQASISLINNKGDVGKTLKELGRSRTVKNLVVAASTASVSNKIRASALANVSDTQWVNNMTVNLADAGSAALINTAVNGGSLVDNLEANILAALVNTAHAESASLIKNINGESWERYAANKIAHAVVGCAAEAAKKGSCQAGAIGSAVGEIWADSFQPANGFFYTDEEKERIIVKGKLIAGTVAAIAGKDVNQAANSAGIAIENNGAKDRLQKALEDALQSSSTNAKTWMKEADALVRKGDIKSLKELDEKLNNFITEKTAYQVGMSDAEMKLWGFLYASSQATREVFLPVNITDFAGGKLVKKGAKAAGILYDINKVAATEHRIAKTVANNRAIGVSYRSSVIETLGLNGNTHKIKNIVTSRNEVVNIIPDATIGGIKGVLVEIKNVNSLTRSKQIRGYAGTGQPILLIVHPRTKISHPIQDTVHQSKGKI